MAELKFHFVGQDAGYQASAVVMLKRCFDEWCCFESIYGRVFPFRELSFVAETASGQLVGHVGVMPFEMVSVDGGCLKCAGVASVGTDPDFRNRGIAAELCQMASQWAQSEHYDLMPLYTSLNRVYSSVGWRDYFDPVLRLNNPRPVEDVPGKRGCDLSAAEKRHIMEKYAESARFPGYVRRTEQGDFNSWSRIFSEEIMRWHLESDGYAMTIDGVLAELAAPAGRAADLARVARQTFLSVRHPAASELRDSNWTETLPALAADCRHGENVMVKTLSTLTELAPIFFSLTDKF